MSSSIPNLKFEANGLYLFLSERCHKLTFHWGLYLAKSPDTGTVYHLLHNGDVWSLETQPGDNLIKTRSFSLALRIAIIEPALHGFVSECLEAIPIKTYSSRFREDVTCRVWVKEALYELDQSGLIKLVWPIYQIETDASVKASVARDTLKRVIAICHGTQS